MGSKERILRHKDDTRRKILDAALNMIKCEGCDALSMRKLANNIEYTAPIIYEYFDNKDALYTELARKGYLQLAAKMQEAKKEHQSAEAQIKAMWLAYWNFAEFNKEIYQLMFGVDVGCSPIDNKIPEAALFPKLIKDAIASLYLPLVLSDEQVQRKFYTYWSIIYGLIAINMVQATGDKKMNERILIDAINGITAAMPA